MNIRCLRNTIISSALSQNDDVIELISDDLEKLTQDLKDLRIRQLLLEALEFRASATKIDIHFYESIGGVSVGNIVIHRDKGKSSISTNDLPMGGDFVPRWEILVKQSGLIPVDPDEVVSLDLRELKEELQLGKEQLQKALDNEYAF